MGDFNDDPVNVSLTKHLGAVGDKKKNYQKKDLTII